MAAMAETEAYDDLQGQSGGDDGVANPDCSNRPLPQLPEPGSCRAGRRLGGGPHAHDEDDGPETAGDGEQAGQSGGGGGGQTERPADGRGGSHRGPHEDGDDKVDKASTTASSSSDVEIHSNNQPVGSGTTIHPGKSLSGERGELNLLPIGSRCKMHK